MARTRLLKPSFFKNEDLADLPIAARLLFAGLWTLADREGRLEDRPRRIKAELFPYDSQNCDVLLQELDRCGFICRYQTEGFSVIQIESFSRHQNPHPSEKSSELPEIPADINLNEKSRKNIVKHDKAGTSRALTLNPYTLTLNPSDAPSELNFQAWIRYHEHRRDIKAKPLTEKGAQAAMKKWCQHSHAAQAAAVEHSIEQGYQGCFPEKYDRTAKPNDQYYDEIREFVANADD